MEHRKKEQPALDMREAAVILDRVFKECGTKPNSVPMEALSAYTIYRREKFGLQRAVLLALLAVFFLLPFLFIDSGYTVRLEETGERKLPVYVIEVSSFLPVYRVTAQVRGQNLPVYEADARTYTVEPTRNGQMRIDVALVNRQNTTRYVEVTDVDNSGPTLLSNAVRNRKVYLYVEDRETGLNLRDVRAVTASGEEVAPVETDDRTGKVVFAYPKEDMDVYIPDCIGNVLHLSMKRNPAGREDG